MRKVMGTRLKAAAAIGIIAALLNPATLVAAEEIVTLQTREGVTQSFLLGTPANPPAAVAVLFPGAMVFSSKWQKECPVLANVGKRNGVMGANWAFETEPDYFVTKA